MSFLGNLLVQNTILVLKILFVKNHIPFDDEADSMALVQDAFKLGDAISAGSFEGDLIGDAYDLHGTWITGYFAVGNRHHVIQTQGLSWRQKTAIKRDVDSF